MVGIAFPGVPPSDRPMSKESYEYAKRLDEKIRNDVFIAAPLLFILLGLMMMGLHYISGVK